MDVVLKKFGIYHVFYAFIFIYFYKCWMCFSISTKMKKTCLGFNRDWIVYALIAKDDQFYILIHPIFLNILYIEYIHIT
jgi:hypothetical protein